MRAYFLVLTPDNPAPMLSFTIYAQLFAFYTDQAFDVAYLVKYNVALLVIRGEGRMDKPRTAPLVITDTIPTTVAPQPKFTIPRGIAPAKKSCAATHVVTGAIPTVSIPSPKFAI